MTGESARIERVAVALDTAEWSEFERWCRLFGPRVGALKVGLEAYLRWGDRALGAAGEHAASLFLDLKLHDIPNTVAGAVRSIRARGADLLTVHASGGPAMLEAAAEAAEGDLDLLAVTVLTHLDAEALATLDLPGPSEERVGRWTTLARAAGCAGVVCSPLEVAALRAANPAPFLFVTPGIRPAGAGRDDQRRVASPGAALASGADLLVIGRPLTRAEDPIAALEALALEMA
ncbi:MAG TPA: orotidine-5'-phosphate decarboxylase [Thermoanaerobaculia bacterium]|nr:orotidine-5'-phosphate decarboxylase [Thermoanaerobaculia bacterium]